MLPRTLPKAFQGGWQTLGLATKTEWRITSMQKRHRCLAHLCFSSRVKSIAINRASLKVVISGACKPLYSSRPWQVQRRDGASGNRYFKSASKRRSGA